MRHVAIYCRVSSKAQDTASQEADLKRWAESCGESVVWYRDKFTGKTMNRPGWNKLATAMQNGNVSRVVVWRLDRLGRTAKGLTALIDELSQRKINLVSLRDGIDLSTAAGRMMANVLASIAQFETEIRAERVFAGQAAARANGKTWGGSEKGRMIKVTPEQIEMINRMKSDGKKIAAIARATGLSRPTVYARLAE
jgi:DNA invertase Pin-like site-specific DNA recombinase